MAGPHPSERTGRPDDYWHTRLISGFWNGVACLKAIGGAPIGQDPYDPDNPDGWKPHQLVTAEWVDKRLELLAESIDRLREQVEIGNAINEAILVNLREAHETEPLEEPAITSAEDDLS